MNNEQTNKTDTSGKETNQEQAEPKNILNEYDKALALVERREKATAEEKLVLARKEKLEANKLLAGEVGGPTQTKPLSAEDLKRDAAAEFFKGTSLEKAIKPDVKE